MVPRLRARAQNQQVQGLSTGGRICRLLACARLARSVPSSRSGRIRLRLVKACGCRPCETILCAPSEACMFALFSQTGIAMRGLAAAASGLAVLGVVVFLLGHRSGAEPPIRETVAGTPNAGGSRPVRASIKEVMQSIVDPSADVLWGAVGTL